MSKQIGFKIFYLMSGFLSQEAIVTNRDFQVLLKDQIRDFKIFYLGLSLFTISYCYKHLEIFNKDIQVFSKGSNYGRQNLLLGIKCSFIRSYSYKHQVDFKKNLFIQEFSGIFKRVR